jgi:hypothetical protein
MSVSPNTSKKVEEYYTLTGDQGSLARQQASNQEIKREKNPTEITYNFTLQQKTSYWLVMSQVTTYQLTFKLVRTDPPSLKIALLNQSNNTSKSINPKDVLIMASNNIVEYHLNSIQEESQLIKILDAIIRCEMSATGEISLHLKK